MSDNPDSGMAEDEEVTSHLLALLYPDDLDSDLAGEFSHEAQAELHDFRSMLGVFRELPDEEPPVAISNMLLAQAAKQAPAPKKAEGKGIFARISDFLLPAVYHPGLASAATLVLVAGLGATLYVNGKSQVAEPTVATQAAAPQADEAVGIINLQERSNKAGEQKEDSPADLEKAVASEEIVTADPAAATPEAAAPVRKALGDLKNEASRQSAATDSEFKAGAKRERSLDGLVGGSISGGGGGDQGVDSVTTKSSRNARAAESDSNLSAPDSSSSTGARRGPKANKAKPAVGGKRSPATKGKGKAKSPAPKAPKAPKAKPRPSVDSKDKTAPQPEPTPAADPAPPPNPAPGGTNRDTGGTSTVPQSPAEAGDDDDDDADEGEGAEEARAPQKKPADSTAAAALHKKAIGAATQNQCSKVKSLGQQIRKLSSAYYDRTFLSDKRLSACLAPEVKK